MDALSFHAAGIGIAVAPLGTAFTSSQARQLKRWSDTVIFCFDADEAGRKAAERSCSIAAAASLEVKIARMQGGKDASEILEKVGAEGLKNVPDSTINGGDFLIRRARELFDVTAVEGKSKAIGFLYPYIGALDSEVKRSAFLESASRELGANPVSVLADYVSSARSALQRAPSREREDPESNSINVGMPARTGDLVMLSALVLNPERFGRIRETLKPDDVYDARARDLYFALEESWRAGETGVEAVLSRVGDEAARRFVLSVSATGELSENADRFIDDGLAVVKRRSLERRRVQLLSAMANSDASEERDGPSLNDLLYEKMTLDAELSARKGEVDERS
jgi:DNA primase